MPEIPEIKAIKAKKKPKKSAVSAVKHSVKRKYNVENLTPYKKGEERTKRNASLGGTVKAMNASVLKANVKVVAESGKLPEITKKALTIAETDPEMSLLLLNIVEKASKITGSTFDQSPDAKQKIELDGKMDNTLEVVMTKA